MEAHQAVSALFVFSPAKFFLQKKISSNFIKKYGGFSSKSNVFSLFAISWQEK
jgi:hypothetical protein